MESPDAQLMQYIPVLILGIVAVAFAAGTLLVSVLVGKRGRDSRIKDTAYECGMLPVGEGGHPAVGEVLPGGHAVYSI